MRLKHTSIHSVEQGESFKPHFKAIGHEFFAMCVILSYCKQFLILYMQALSQASEDGLTIPVMSVCLA